MRRNKLSSLVLVTLMTASCGSNIQSITADYKTIKQNEAEQLKPPVSAIKLTKADISSLDREYSGFTTKAVPSAYFKAKLTKLIGNDNGIVNATKIIRELEYARYKTEAVIPFQAMVTASPAFLTTLTGVTAVDNQRTADSGFDNFITNNSLAAPVASAASGITSSGFTANWAVVANASSGYVLTVKQGATVVSTINVASQAATSQAVTGLAGLTAYTYTVRAKNGALLSTASNSISVSTPNPLLAPVASAASGITSSGFTANWAVVANATSGYVLTVNLGATVVSTINVASQAATSQAVTGLPQSTAYTYTVQAQAGALLSVSSNTISVSTIFIHFSFGD